MTTIVTHALLSTIPVYVFFAIGFWLRSKGALKAEEDKPVMQLAMDVAYPCLIFYNIMRYMVVEGNAEISTIGFTLRAAGCGFVEMLVGVGAAWVVARMLRLHIGSGLRTFTLTAGMQNYAFFVIPIVQMLFSAPGDSTLGVLFVHNVGCEIFVWSFGVMLMRGSMRDMDIGVFMRGPLLAVVVSLILVWSGLGQYVAQAPVMKAAEMTGAVATPVSLILFGCFMSAPRRGGNQAYHGDTERNTKRRDTGIAGKTLRWTALGGHADFTLHHPVFLCYPAVMASAWECAGRANHVKSIYDNSFTIYDLENSASGARGSGA